MHRVVIIMIMQGDYTESKKYDRKDVVISQKLILLLFIVT